MTWGKKPLRIMSVNKGFRSSHFPGPICGILITVSALLPEKREKKVQVTSTPVLCGWQTKGRGGVAAWVPNHALETVDSDSLPLTITALQPMVSKHIADALHMSQLVYYRYKGACPTETLEFQPAFLVYLPRLGHLMRRPHGSLCSKQGLESSTSQ